MPKAVSINWIALVSSLLLLAVIFFIVIREHSFDGLVDVWERTRPEAFGFAIVVMIAIQAASASRLAVIMGADGLDRIGFWPLLRIQFVSQFVANGAPIAALSDLARVAMIQLRFALHTARSLRLVFYERICGALGAVVLGVFAVLGQLIVPTPSELVKAQILLWGAGCVAISTLLAMSGWRLSTKVEFLDRIATAIAGLGRTLRRPMIAAKLLFTSVVVLFGFAIVFIVLARGMQIQVSVPHVFLFMPLIFFVSALPIFYQGWGGREAIVISTIGSTGQVTSAEAIALSVAFGIVVSLASLPGAVLWIMRPSMRKMIRNEIEQQA
jgi:glycosyltransferase 2 family protein